MRSLFCCLIALAVVAVPSVSLAETKGAPNVGGTEKVPSDDFIKKQGSAETSRTSGKLTKADAAALQAGGPAPKERHQSRAVWYDRTTPFWTLSQGPTYDNPAIQAAAATDFSGDYIRLSVGNLDTRSGGFALPVELTTPDTAPGAGQHRYYLVQIKPGLLTDDTTTARTMTALRDLGVKFLDYIPDAAYVVRVDRESLPALRASSMIQFIQPYHPAYKLDPLIGRVRHLDRLHAESEDYTLTLRMFEGERPAVEAALTGMGVEIVPNQDPASSWLLVRTTSSRIFPIARLDGVAAVYEYTEAAPSSEEAQLIVLNGAYSVGARSPYHDAGVDGSGMRKFDVDSPPGPPIETDYNGNGLVDAAAQIVSVTDTGLAIDAGDFAEKRTTAGITSATSTVVTLVNNHRKMKGYVAASVTLSGGSGDTSSCDPGFTHGQSTSSTAAGNATDVPGTTFTPAYDWNGDGTSDSYGAAFGFISGTQTIRVDGVAKGARVGFVDAVGVAGCPETSSTGLNPGNLAAVLTYAHTTFTARLHNFSFGVAQTVAGYPGSAVSIDEFLRANVDSMVFVSAGNSGGDDADPDVFGTVQTLDDGAQNKNALTIGASRHDSRRTRVDFSSVGPAGTGGNRIKPDLMAPGADFGTVGLAADYNCKDDDGTNNTTTDIDCLQELGYQGTSFSSPTAMGAGAVVRDFFASGFYPDGTGTNSTNNLDRANSVSGSLVKAMMLASADAMPGNAQGLNLTRYAYRHNPETGYGIINLSNVMPLFSDPNTPLGLIVHDAGSTNSPSNVRSLSLPTVATDTARHIDTFKIVDPNQELRVALVWIDDGGAVSTNPLANDLSLELIDPGPDATLGNNDDVHYYGNVFTEDFNDDGTIDGNCDIDGNGTAAESCDFDRDGSNDRSPWSRPICFGCGDIDGDGSSNNYAVANGATVNFPVAGLCDTNGDGTITGTACKSKPNDSNNPAEVIVLSPDPNGDGTGTLTNADNQLRAGTWRVIVGHPDSTATVTAQKYALVIAGGVAIQSSVRIDTNPLKCNGDISLEVTEVADAADAGCNLSSCTAGTVAGRTRIEVRNPVFLTDGVDNDGDGTIDEGKPAGPPFDVDTNGDGTKDAGEDLVDLEKGGTSFTLSQPAAGALFFESSVRLPASSSAPLKYDFNDGILAVDDSYNVVGVYDDKVVTTTVTRSSSSKTDCVAEIDLFPIGQPGRNAPYLLTGGCDDDKFFDEGEAVSYQVQLANLDVEILKDTKVTLRARKPIELDGCDNDNDGTIDENDGSEATADPCRRVCAPGAAIASCNQNCDFQFLTIHTPVNQALTDAPPGTVPVDVGSFNQNFAKDVTFAVEVEPGATFPTQVEMVVGLTAIPSGRTVESCEVFRHVMDADLQRFAYSTDFPTGGTTDRDINADEVISNPINDPGNPFPQGFQRDSWDKLNETVTFSDMTTTAFGGGNPGFAGPWDFDSDTVNHQGFRTGLYQPSTNNGAQITQWGEDHNFNNILDGPARCNTTGNPVACTCPTTYPCTNEVGAVCGAGTVTCDVAEKIDGNGDNTLNQNHNLAGGCGWVSHNAASRGIWHTGTILAPGLATCANSGTGASCEYMDSIGGLNATRIWVEFLTTPIFQKIHKKQDGALSTNGKDDDGDGACVGGTTPGAKCLIATDCGGAASCNRIDEDDGADGTKDEGFAYRVELTDWRWNINAEMESELAAMAWEIDMDTSTLDPVAISDGFILNLINEGFGPTLGANVNLIDGFPMFVNNDFGDNAGTAGQRNGVSDQNGDGTIDGQASAGGVLIGTAAGNRFSDRSCVFQSVAALSLGPDFRLRDPEPFDDDCDADANPGADGAPGVRGIDDNADGFVDNQEELCPCYNVPDKQDDDADGRIDEIDELQRFWRCKLTPFQACRTNATCTGGGNACNQFGAPVAYGDDVCGDGKIDENVTAQFAGRDVDGDNTLNDLVILSENGNRLQQNHNWNIGTVNGPFLRFQTVEDFYGVESGESFQAAVAIVNNEGGQGFPVAKNNTYGLAIDDMVVEWTEEHPVNQTPNNNCVIGTAAGGPGGGAGGAGGGEGGGVAAPQRQCGAVALGSDLIFEASTTVPAQVVDVNANAALCTGINTINANCTQGTINCNKYGLGTPGLYSNDCDTDGLFEVEISAFNLEEVEGEAFRLEQDVAASSVYIGNVSISSVLNQKDDGIIFVQWRFIVFPTLTVRYIDRNDGVTGFDMGADGKPGIPLVDDDLDSRGTDKKPGVADLDDDGTGQCNGQSGNIGAVCHVNGDCTETGVCTLIDDSREACRDTNLDGTVNNSDVHFGDDDCTLVDEADELCPNGGIKALFSDDNCGCPLNPREFVLISSFQDADALWAYYSIDDDNLSGTSGDGDGIPDDKEKVRMDVTIRNIMDGIQMEDLSLVLSTRDPDIACITDATAVPGTGPTSGMLDSFGFTATTPADNFEFFVGSPTRTTMLQDRSATFNLAVTGTLVDTAGTRVPFFGTTNPQQQTMDLDLDASVANVNTLNATTKKTIIFNQTASSQCTGGKECYSSPGTAAGGFYNAWAASAFPNRPGLHCQYNNPNNPNVGSTAPPNCFLTQDTGLIISDNDRDNVDDFGNSDWYLHRQQSRSNGLRGHSSGATGIPDANEACMHMGFEIQNGSTQNGAGNQTHQTPNGNDFTTYHLDNIMQVYYKTPFKLGLGRGQNYGGTTNDEDAPTLAFWHQMHVADADMFSNVVDPSSFDGGVVQVLIDRDNDGTPEPGAPSDATKDGWWINMTPYYGRPLQQVQAFGNCHYDPDDDGNTENDIFPGELTVGPSSTCFPQTVWACVGDTLSPNSPDPGLGQSFPGPECYPEGQLVLDLGGVDENGDGTVNGRDTGIAACPPNGADPNDCNGWGMWTEAKFDLMQFRGRGIFIRFLTSAGQFSLPTWLHAFGSGGGVSTLSGNRDDGWFVDDLTVSGIQDGTPFVLKADIDTPPNNNCPTDNCSTNPTAILRVGTFPVRSNNLDDDTDGTIDENDETAIGNTVGVDDDGDGSIDEADELRGFSDAPLRVVDLDAGDSSVAQCFGGQLQYEFLADYCADGTVDKVVTGFSTGETASDNPEFDATYTVNVRCSSDVTGATPCAASDVIFVPVTGGAPILQGLTVTKAGATTTVHIPAGNTVDIVRGDLQSLRSTGGNFTTAIQAISPSADRCLANDTVSTAINDPKANPAINQGYFYIARFVVPCRGTYEEGGSQIGVRNTEVTSATGTCAP